MLQRVWFFVEHFFAGFFATGFFSVVVCLCAVFLLQLAIDHGEARGPHGVLLHLLPQHGHLVLGELQPRGPFAPGARIGRRGGELGEGIAGGYAGDGAVDVCAQDALGAGASGMAVSVLLELAGRHGEVDVGPGVRVGVVVVVRCTAWARAPRWQLARSAAVSLTGGGCGVAGGIEGQAQVGRSLVAGAHIGLVGRGGDGRRGGVARRGLWLGVQLALDDGRALAMAHRDLVQARGLGVCVLALVDGLLQMLGNLLAQQHGIRALLLGQGGELAVQRREVVHVLDGVAVRRVEMADERQGAHQVRGEEVGVVEEVVHRRLRIRVGRGRGRGLGHVDSVFDSVLDSVFGCSHGVLVGGARQPLQPRVDGRVGENQGGGNGTEDNVAKCERCGAAAGRGRTFPAVDALAR